MIQINPNRKIENNFPDSTPKTATNNFTTLDGGLVNSLTVDMTPIQDLHGYDKPWAEGAGKNKLPISAASLKSINTGVGVWTDDTYTLNGVSFELMTDSDGNVESIKINGNPSSNVDFKIGGAYGTTTPFASADNYTSSMPTSSSVVMLAGYGSTVLLNNSTMLTANCPDGLAWCLIRVPANSTNNNVIVQPMVRLSSIADPTFEPYSNICPISGHTEAKSKINDTVYTTSLGTTVYGGEVDQVSGDGEVTYGYVDLGSLTWSEFNTRNNLKRMGSSDISSLVQPATASSEVIPVMCSIYSAINSDQTYNEIIGACIDTTGKIIIYDPRYNQAGDSTAFKTAMNGIYLVYPLATPTTLTLTGQSITAEVGENNVSAPLDGQEIQTDGVTYKEMFSWADVVAYVQSQVNP